MCVLSGVDPGADAELLHQHSQHISRLQAHIEASESGVAAAQQRITELQTKLEDTQVSQSPHHLLKGIRSMHHLKQTSTSCMNRSYGDEEYAPGNHSQMHRCHICNGLQGESNKNRRASPVFAQ
jgi:hypothetical protein